MTDRSTRDRHDGDEPLASTKDIERLMMPGNYLPRKHRSRKMPARKPRVNAVWTSQSDGYDR